MATAYAYGPELDPERTAATDIADFRRVRFTAEQFLDLDALGAFAERKVELVDGELWEEKLPGWTHARLQGLVIGLLMSAASRSIAVVGELSVRISPSTVRDFDVGITANDVGDVRAVEPLQVRLAVEIAVTTLPTDLSIKTLEYARAGIPAYWVVDARAEVVHAMRSPGPDGYAERRVVRFTEPLDVPGGGTIVIAQP